MKDKELQFSRRKFNKGLGLLLLSLSYPGQSWGKNQRIAIRDLRVWHPPKTTQIVLELTRPAKYDVFTLEHPPRLVVDLHNTGAKIPARKLKLQHTSITRVRSAARGADSVRVVFDLKHLMHSHAYLVNPNQDYRSRLFIDLTQSSSHPHSHDHHKGHHPTQDQYKRSEKVVVIDPGHGGEDPGAIGVGGIEEKAIVLRIARDMHHIINSKPGYRAVMTRDDDYYIGLRERVQVAHKHDADMLVSVHADAFTDSIAYGSSAFVLSHGGKMSESLHLLVSSQNCSDIIGGIDPHYLNQHSMLSKTLLDMELHAASYASHKIGNNILNNIGSFNRLHQDRVQPAPFVVLKSSDIPSVLVETGFITNKVDNHKLRQTAYQQHMAAAICEGIFKSLEHGRSGLYA